MNLVLRWIGKTKNPHLEALIGDYLTRIRHFADVSLLESRPVTIQRPDQALAAEGRRLLGRLGKDDYLVAVDPRGQQWESERWAEFIAERREHSLKKTVFVLGGPGGLSETVRHCSHRVLSLSSLTFSHEIARLVLLEQIYRAFTLVHRIPYHK